MTSLRASDPRRRRGPAKGEPQARRRASWAASSRPQQLKTPPCSDRRWDKAVDGVERQRDEGHPRGEKSANASPGTVDELQILAIDGFESLLNMWFHVAVHMGAIKRQEIHSIELEKFDCSLPTVAPVSSRRSPVAAIEDELDRLDGIFAAWIYESGQLSTGRRLLREERHTAGLKRKKVLLGGSIAVRTAEEEVLPCPGKPPVAGVERAVAPVGSCLRPEMLDVAVVTLNRGFAVTASLQLLCPEFALHHRVLLANSV